MSALQPMQLEPRPDAHAIDPGHRTKRTEWLRFVTGNDAANSTYATSKRKYGGRQRS
jgi:hypothetical protein